jgi:hypothetical protein
MALGNYYCRPMGSAYWFVAGKYAGADRAP